jgi:hypothetical protein
MIDKEKAIISDGLSSVAPRTGLEPYKVSVNQSTAPAATSSGNFQAPR